MIRSSNGVRLLSSHLTRDACRSIYEGVFQRTLDSGVWTLSRVIGGGVGGHATVNLNNRVLPNTSIRGSVSLSRADYERRPYPGYRGMSPIDGVSEVDFQKGFEDWCRRFDKIFSSEGEKDYMFKWFCDNHPYGCHFYYGGLPPDVLIDGVRKYGNEDPKIVSEALLEMLRQAAAFPDEDVSYSNTLSWDELDEYQARRCSGRYIGSDRLADIEPDT